MLSYEYLYFFHFNSVFHTILQFCLIKPIVRVKKQKDTRFY